MSTEQSKDITVRGGIINFPPSTEPKHPLRHQPNTPPTKKRTTTRPDHKIYVADPSKTVKDEPPKQETPPDKPSNTAAAPPVPPKPETETVSEE